LKAGDLIWYNCGGSKQKGLVLDIRDMLCFSRTKQPMALIHWFINFEGVRPASYDSNGMRLFGKTIWENKSREIDYEWIEGWTSIETHVGRPTCKIISEA